MGARTLSQIEIARVMFYNKKAKNDNEKRL